MNSRSAKDTFLQSSAEWICNSFSLTIRYLATRDGNGLKVLDAVLIFGPLPLNEEYDFSIEVKSLVAGHKTFPSLTQDLLQKKLNDAADGLIEVNGLTLRLEEIDQTSYFSAPPRQDKWFFNLELSLRGKSIQPVEFQESVDIDHSLRAVSPPFDGLDELCTWLQLSDPRSGMRQPTISINVNSPADVILSETNISENKLHAVFHAHPELDVAKVGFAIREFPGSGISTRKQVAKDISWKQPRKGIRKGTLDIRLKKSDSLLTMLTVSGLVVRRQWFLDPNKSENSRYVATQLFDKDLKQLRDAILSSVDQDRFERGISSLLFLLGFSPAIQVETQAPDILLTTPGRKMAVIECTMKIGDFQSKLGKLVDRRNALFQSFSEKSQPVRVDAFLICRLTRAQIAVDEDALIKHNVTLLTNEDLNSALDQIRLPPDPDEYLDKAFLKFAAYKNSISFKG